MRETSSWLAELYALIGDFESQLVLVICPLVSFNSSLYDKSCCMLGGIDTL